MASLHLHLLGSVRVERDDNDIEVKPRKALALLIYLAVTSERHTRDALATLLWPSSSQRSARHSLRSRLSELNRLLGGGRLGVRVKVTPRSLESAIGGQPQQRTTS